MKKRPTIPRIDGGQQTILLVEDVVRTAQFYQENLRLGTKDGDGKRYVEFETGDGGTLLIVQRDGSIAPMAEAAGAETAATLTFSITAEGYDGWKKWMKKRGIAIEQETRWIHGGRSLYVLDPDGRRIEFKAPAGRRGAAEPAADKAAAAPAQSAPAEPAPAPRLAETPAKPAPAKPASVPANKKPEAAGKPSPTASKSAVAKDSAAKPSVPAPPVRGVVETILYTDDLPRAVAFYCDLLGLKPMTGDGVRFQAFDSGVGRVLLVFKRGATLEPVPAPVGMIPPHDGHGPLHIAFAIDAADYGAWCTRLRSQGIAIESETHWDRGGRSVYFRDPDNHLVELITPGIWPNY